MIACEAAQLLHFPNPSDNLKECHDNVNKGTQTWILSDHQFRHMYSLSVVLQTPETMCYDTDTMIDLGTLYSWQFLFQNYSLY